MSTFIPVNPNWQMQSNQFSRLRAHSIEQSSSPDQGLSKELLVFELNEAYVGRGQDSEGYFDHREIATDTKPPSSHLRGIRRAKYRCSEARKKSRSLQETRTTEHAEVPPIETFYQQRYTSSRNRHAETVASSTWQGGSPTRSVLEAPILRDNIVAQRTTLAKPDTSPTTNADTKTTDRKPDDDDDSDTGPNCNAIHKIWKAKLAPHQTLPSPPSSSDESTIIICSPASPNQPPTHQLTSIPLLLALPSHAGLATDSRLLTIRLRPTNRTTSRALPLKTLPPLLFPSLPPTIPSETFDPAISHSHPSTDSYPSNPTSVGALLLNQNNHASDKRLEDAASRAWKVALTPARDLGSSGNTSSAFARVAVLRAATALVRRGRRRQAKKVAFGDGEARGVLGEWKGLR